MIAFTKKADTVPTIREGEENRFEQIRKTAKERHLKSDIDGARRREAQTVEDNRII